jgi:hypothetical protein
VLTRQQQRVHDAQHAVGRIGRACLTDRSASRGWIPVGLKVAAAQLPSAALGRDLEVGVSVEAPAGHHGDVELEGWSREAAEETMKPLLEHHQQRGIAGGQCNRHVANLDDDARC